MLSVFLLPMDGVWLSGLCATCIEEEVGEDAEACCMECAVRPLHLALLHAAAIGGQKDTAEFLMRSGVDPEVTDQVRMNGILWFV